MDGEAEIQQAKQELKNVKQAREQWLNYEISDEELAEVFSRCNYPLQVKAGLSREFDDISQVGCAVELLKERPGMDRREMMKRWDVSIKGPLGVD